MRTTTAKDLEKVCWLCGRNGSGDPLDAHHIFGGANRKLSEQYGLVVPLCHFRCHESGPKAAHRCRETMQELREWGQAQIMSREGWSIEDFRRIFGRNYLPLDWEPETVEEEGFRETEDEVRLPF